MEGSAIELEILASDDLKAAAPYFSYPHGAMITYYTASSLDGFLATNDDSVDFLDGHAHEDTFTEFNESIDCIVMGSATYEFNLRWVNEGNDWPFRKPVWVFTTRQLPVPEGADVRFATDVATARKEMPEHVWVCGGGGLAAQFHEAGLLDKLVITIAPVTLGEGKPLFPVPATFKLTSARKLGDFAELQYESR